jgi:hypothetical protein
MQQCGSYYCFVTVHLLKNESHANRVGNKRDATRFSELPLVGSSGEADRPVDQ